jgi:hypothetical protein
MEKLKGPQKTLIIQTILFLDKIITSLGKRLMPLIPLNQIFIGTLFWKITKQKQSYIQQKNVEEVPKLLSNKEELHPVPQKLEGKSHLQQASYTPHLFINFRHFLLTLLIILQIRIHLIHFHIHWAQHIVIHFLPILFHHTVTPTTPQQPLHFILLRLTTLQQLLHFHSLHLTTLQQLHHFLSLHLTTLQQPLHFILQPLTDQ